ncbi:MAG TPA: hypothetical protein VFE33_31195 [Thermoanaerobaculia bacterium]|nr:hypothetical protein [Thermoanaerobaculia bacterium]
MPTLRLTQSALGDDLHRVEIALEDVGARQSAEVCFPLRFDDADPRDLTSLEGRGAI